MTRLPPLALLLATIALSAALAAADPLPSSTSAAVRATGALLIMGGMGTAFAGVFAFRRWRTTVDPRYPERATALVTDGVYRWTRNPMYLGFIVVATGAAAVLGSLLALVGPVLLAVYLDRLQIPAEERALRARFGDAFDAYASTVRRWAGVRSGPPVTR